MAHELLESGAVDLIVGHHAHVIQPVEFVGAGVVVYGTGNLLSNQTAKVGPPEVRDGVLLHVDLDSRAGNVRITRLEATPTWVQHPDLLVRSIPRALDAPDLGAELREQLEASAARTMCVLGPSVAQCS